MSEQDAVEGDVEDLFGSEDEEESQQPPQQQPPQQETGGQIKEPPRAEEEAEEEVEGGSEMRVEVAADLPRPPEGAQLHTLKLPASVLLVREAFDPEWFDGSPEVGGDAEADGAIRWRFSGNGDEKESNARLVRWADGSMHLFIGNTAYDVLEEELDGNIHLGARFRSALLCHGPIASKLVIQPLTTAHSKHRSAAAGMAAAAYQHQQQQQQQPRRVRLIATDVDPEWELANRRRLEAQLDRSDAANAARRRKHERSVSGLSSHMLEEGDSGAAALYRAAPDDEAEAAASKRLLEAKAATSASHQPPPQRRRK